MKLFGQKKWSKLLAWLLVATMMLGDIVITEGIVASAADTETITINFDDGDKGGFTGRGSAQAEITEENVYGGSGKSLLVTGRTSNWEGTQRDVTAFAPAGTELTVTAYVRNNESENIDVNMTLQYKVSGSSGDSYAWVGGSTIAAGEWKQLQGTITVADSTESALIYFESPSANASFSIDNVVISKPKVDSGEEQEFDVDYEEGTTYNFEDENHGWWSFGTATLSVGSDDGYKGTGGLNVSGRGANYAGPGIGLDTLLQDGEQLAGRTLSATALIKNTEESDRTMAVSLKLTKSDGSEEYVTLASASVKAGKWAQLSSTEAYTIGEDVTGAVVYIQTTDSTDKDDFIVDCVNLVLKDASSNQDTEQGFDVDYEEGTTYNFEDENHGWWGFGQTTLTIGSTDGYKGTGGLNVSGRGANYAGPGIGLDTLLQDGEQLAGRMLSATALIKNTEESDRTMAVSLKLTKSDGSEEYVTLASASVEAGKWAQLSSAEAYTIGEDVTGAVVYIQTTDSTDKDDFIVDCVNLVLNAASSNPDDSDDSGEPDDSGAGTEETISPFEKKIIDFEDGKTFFDNRGDAKGAITTDAHGGSNALAVTNRTDTWQGVEKDLTGAELAGKGLKVSFWLKNTSSVAAEFSVSLQEDIGSKTTYNRIGAGEAAPGEWICISGTINVQKDTVKPVIYFESAEAEASFVIDDVTLETVAWVDNTSSASNMSPFTSLEIDFEDGKRFFTNRGDATGEITTDAHGGSKALAVSGRTATWQGVEKDLSGAELEGKSLTVSYWIKNTTNKTAQFNLSLQQKSSTDEVSYSQIATVEAAPGKWVQVTGTTNIEKNTVQPVIYFESSDATATFIIDDVKMTVGAWQESLENQGGSGSTGGSTVDPFTSLLIDFEDGETFFDNRGDAKATITSKAHGGKKALSITGRTATWQGVEKDLSGAKVTGKNLSVTFWARNDSSAPMTIGVTLQQDFKSADTSYNSIASEEVAPGEWVEISGDINISADTTKPVIYFEGSNATGSFTIDDVKLVVGEAVDDSVKPFESLKIDFENGRKYFDKRGDVKVSITTDAHDSEKALAISGRTEAWNGVEKDFTDANLAGKIIKVTFWVKHNESTPQEIALSIQEENEAGEVTYNRVAGVADIPAGQWIQLTGEYFVNEGSVKTVLYFEATEPTASFIIDDVEITVEEPEVVQKDNTSEDKEVEESTTVEEEPKAFVPWVWILVVSAVVLIALGVFLLLKRKKAN